MKPGAPRILVAPQELKGTLTARQAAEAIATGVRRSRPEASVDLLPLADGGPGTLDALLDALGGETHRAEVGDPLGRKVWARWGAFPKHGFAVVEMAEASGLWRLRPEERSPRQATTRGTGELIREALEAGFERIWVGCGGSATTDAGAGALAALGARLLDEEGAQVPPGGEGLTRLHVLDLTSLHSRLSGAWLEVLTDVSSPLLGPRGAAAVFGPQKGAGPSDVTALEAGLARLAELASEQLGDGLAHQPGAGAAGGLAFGLLLTGRAELRSGFEAVAEATRLRERLAAADWVVTAEGRFDAQSLLGKTTGRVLELARAASKRAVVFAGSVAEGPVPDAEVVDLQGDATAGNEEAARLLTEAAAKWAAGSLAS